MCLIPDKLDLKFLRMTFFFLFDYFGLKKHASFYNKQLLSMGIHFK